MKGGIISQKYIYASNIMPSKIQTVGLKAKVYHGTALHTTGGLEASDLMKNKRGRIVSVKKHEQGLRAYARNGLTPRDGEGMAKLRAMRR
jgi:hypothetical protein